MSNHRLHTALQFTIALLFLLPLFWMLGASFLPIGKPLPQTFHLLPALPTFQNFQRIWQIVPIARFTLNSLLITSFAVLLTLLTSSWAGFAISQLPRPSQQRWVMLSLAILMVPGIALWSTRFLLFKYLGWLDTIWALIAPAWMGTSPFFVLMFYRAFRRIPLAIYDSARVDGGNAITIWSNIALPMVRPTLLGVALLSFALYWGDFLSPLLYLNGEQLYTLPVALQTLHQMSRSDWPLLMAAAVWTTAIPIALFLLVQPFFSQNR